MAIWTNSLSVTFFYTVDMSREIESTNSQVLQFSQQLGQTVQIRPESLQLQFAQKCDGNSAGNK